MTSSTASLPIANVDDEDHISRLIFDPHMRDEERKFIWHCVFEFPSVDGMTESTVWRRIIPEDRGVHDIGVEKEARDRIKERKSSYVGFITAVAGEIRASRTAKGHGFCVYPAREEGDYHTHIKIVLSGGAIRLDKNDKFDIRLIMQKRFGPLTAFAGVN